MDERQEVSQSGSQNMENSLLWPILEILSKQPTGWKVHTLAHELMERGYIGLLDASPGCDLFKRNFLIMNALYHLQANLYPERWLQVVAMDIALMNVNESSCEPIETNNPLREYYLDWDNYEANEGEVHRLLNQFWQQYQRYIGGASNNALSRSKALSLFELNANASSGDIRKQWRKLAFRWHPDKENGDAERFKALCDAWNILRIE